MNKFTIGLFALLLIAGCNEPGVKTTKDTITVSILPQKYILEQIAGDKFQINVLVPDGSGPETYEPTGIQMQKMSRSKACIITGLLDFEKDWLTKVSAQYADLMIINTSTGVDLIAGHEDHGDDHQHAEGEHHHHAGGIDPHIWLSLKAIKVQSQNIMESLVKLDPENKTLYEDNYKKFDARLDSIDGVIADKFKALAKPASFMIYHPSLSYYSNDYGIEQISIELEGKEPSPAYMKELIDKAKKVEISTIFYSEQFDKRSAETIAKQLGISLAAFNPLEENVEKNLLSITESIVNSTVK